MHVRVGLWWKLSTEEWMLLNCGVEETLESPLYCKETQSVHPKGNQNWIFIGRTDAEAEAPILWPAKLLQLCPTLCDPIDGSPPGFPSLGFSRQEHWSGLPFPSPMHESEKWKWSHSVVSASSNRHGLQPTRLLRPWDFPGKSTGVGCHTLATWCAELTHCKDPDAGKNWRWEKGMAEDEMVGWYHHLYRLEFMWSPGVGDGQGRLVCSSPWGRKESDTTERLNLTECYWCCLGNHGEFRMTWT